jgi:hypothetical protein
MNSLIVCACISEILCVAASMYFPALLPNFQTEWGLAFATLGLVAMSGTVWLKLFRSNHEEEAQIN